MERQMKKVKVDWGFACGRAWIEIDGKTICQTEGDDLWMQDDKVRELIKLIFPEEWANRNKQ
jgi:hypothetical protein